MCLVCNQFWNLSVFVDEEEEKETNNEDFIKKKKSWKRQASSWDEGWRDRNWREPVGGATGMPSYKETVALQSHRGHLGLHILLGHHKLWHKGQGERCMKSRWFTCSTGITNRQGQQPWPERNCPGGVSGSHHQEAMRAAEVRGWGRGHLEWRVKRRWRASAAIPKAAAVHSLTFIFQVCIRREVP